MGSHTRRQQCDRTGCGLAVLAKGPAPPTEGRDTPPICFGGHPANPVWVVMRSGLRQGREAGRAQSVITTGCVMGERDIGKPSSAPFCEQDPIAGRSRSRVAGGRQRTDLARRSSRARCPGVAGSVVTVPRGLAAGESGDYLLGGRSALGNSSAKRPIAIPRDHLMVRYIGAWRRLAGTWPP